MLPGRQSSFAAANKEQRSMELCYISLVSLHFRTKRDHNTLLYSPRQTVTMSNSNCDPGSESDSGLEQLHQIAEGGVETCIMEEIPILGSSDDGSMTSDGVHVVVVVEEMSGAYAEPEPRDSLLTMDSPPPVTFPVPEGNPLLESNVSCLLHSHGIGNFLAGETAQSILGSPILPRFSAWGVSDHQIDQAATVLREAKFPECKDFGPSPPGGKKKRPRCHALIDGPVWREQFPKPIHHFHTDHRYPTKACHSDSAQTQGIFLYRQSQLLDPDYPDPPAHPPTPDDPYYTVTCHRDLPERCSRQSHIRLNCRGRQSPEYYPVTMLRPERYAHNLVYLMLRDLGYSAYAWWEDEFRSLVTFSSLGGTQHELAWIRGGPWVQHVSEGSIRDWMALNRIPGNLSKKDASRRRATIRSRFATLYREMQSAGRLGQPLLSPIDVEEGTSQSDVEDLLARWANVSPVKNEDPDEDWAKSDRSGNCEVM
ncbi:uncharacterized protein BO66DRAFT_452116 [Aspergillus aculeatinus CBS 121060]|uniref:Uncharacterized protein n=1 Tax=Aspergillus aculeatinus CBS 121060 TaxID=1448322 RepID=A0ACD1H907_9EURO|nr:hypothetical protein BO66DRAFT_452116 [Aspergillus aculeatinus CBS 121060]RAH70067.1 hypothetical protein BO66DRAFT_452116 [Aspergillus aculeatinus CBS 121060]